MLEAAGRAAKGQIDADPGGEVIKQRIARPGQGRSRGSRRFKEAAKRVLALTDEQLAQLLNRGDYMEVKAQ